MNVDIFADLLLLAIGIGISEAYHARLRAMLRTLQGRPSIRRMARPTPQPRVKARQNIRRRKPHFPIIDEMHLYPAPAAATFYMTSPKVIKVDEWQRRARGGEAWPGLHRNERRAG